MPMLSSLSYQWRTCCSNGNTTVSVSLHTMERSTPTNSCQNIYFFCRFSKHETWRSRLALRDIAFEKKRREKKAFKLYLWSIHSDTLFMIIWCTYYFYLKQMTVEWTQNQNPFRKMLESQMLTIAAILHNWLVKAKIILDKLLIWFKFKLKQLELSTTLCFSCKI